MRTLLALALLIPLISLACAGGPSAPEEKPKTPRQVADRFFSLWREKQYSPMYDLVSLESQGAIPRDKFVGRYEAITEEATITGIDYEIAATVPEEATEIPVKATIHTAFFGDIVQDNTIPLVQDTIEIQPSPGSDDEAEERQEWRVKWHPSLIFKELDDRTLVHFFTRVPRRGAIYERSGQPLALDAQLPVIGIVPELIKDKEQVIGALSQALSLPPPEIRAQVEAQVPSYYFVPVKTLPYGTTEDQLVPFYAMSEMGVVVREETRRVYPQGEAAAHVLGYLAEATVEQLQGLGPKGYKPGDKVGAAGLEGQYDRQLAGERGGVLATITPEGTIARTLAEKPEKQGLDLHLALDINVQKTAEAALGERVGSVVVINPQDNSVLALASYPRFNPNEFIKGLSSEAADKLINDPRQPFLHRPLLATYPPGSTFKVVTAAAGLERGGFYPYSTVPCTPVWSGLGPEFVKKNWQSVDRGPLTPAQGLMASCNPVFYEMALALDHEDPAILPQFARDFGFGGPTGIGLEEAGGVAPGPDWKEENVGEPWYSGDTVNMGIGQGFLLVTPLQIANAYSAIADGAALRKPLLIKKIASPDGALAQEYNAETIRPLPVSQPTLDTIREGLRLVTQSPGGTAYGAFAGSGIDVAGKSGTAEDEAFGSQQAFFVAYAPVSNPSLLVLVQVEGVWSREAAPLVRRILETHVGSAAATSAP